MKTMIVIHSKKNEVVMDKAIYFGFIFLELSKLHMYETFYDFITTIFCSRKFTITLN